MCKYCALRRCRIDVVQCDFLSAEGTGAAAQFLLAKGNFDYGGDIAGNVSVHQHFRHGPVQENADRLAASGRHCNYLLVVALLLEPPGPPGSRSGLAVAEAEFHRKLKFHLPMDVPSAPNM